jgi:membrane protein YdbS with pleckstrin-like domain
MSDQKFNEQGDWNQPDVSDQPVRAEGHLDASATPPQEGGPTGGLTSAQKGDASGAQKLEGAIWQGRMDWRSYSGVIILSGLGIVLLCAIVVYAASHTSLTGGWAFLICLMIVALVSMGVGLWVLLQVMQTRYRLTDQRLFIERGVFSQTIDQIELIRVDDVRVRKKFIDRLWGLGSIELLTTDTSDSHLLIKGIRNPEDIAEHVRTCMRELRSRSLFIENL